MSLPNLFTPASDPTEKSCDWKTLTAEELEAFDAEDRPNDDNTSDVDWDEIVADFRAELRGDGPASVRIDSFEEFQAFLHPKTK